MTFKDQLQEDMKAAMRQRDALRLSTIRMVRAAIVNAEIAKGGPLEDAYQMLVHDSGLRLRRFARKRQWD